MCGIFGYIGKRNNAASIIFQGLKTLEYRGYDSWGIAIVQQKPNGGNYNAKEKKHIVIKKQIGKIGNATVDKLPQSSLGIGHTRWATHGGVTTLNAHPHLDCTGNLAVIHNGIFENYEEVKKKLAEKGHHFISQTDTEVIVHLVEEYRKTSEFPFAVQNAFNNMGGLNAIIVLEAKSQMLVAARNGSPLVVGFGKTEKLIASDAAALLPHTKIVQYLEDDEMAIITKDAIKILNTKTNQSIPEKKQTLTWSVTQTQKGKFPFFMLKEIHEQPALLTEIATKTAAESQRLARIIKKSYGTYMVGCGSAAYVCLAGSYLFSKIAKRHVNYAIGSEFGYHLDFLTPKSLVMALSQSGETMDTLESVKKAKRKGAKILSLVNVFGSTLYRESDYTLLTGVGPEKSVASTKDVTGKLAHLTLLSYALAGKISTGQKIIFQAAKSSESLLKPGSVRLIKILAAKLQKSEHIYVIGRGLSYPTSLEAAMKIKEISYIHAEGMAAGELKHGPLALLEKGTPCVVFAPDDETYGANVAAAMEMKARGGYIIGISNKVNEVFDAYLKVEDAKEATIIPNIIVGQLLAYYLAREKNLDPDKPRNLAKSVTVK